MDHHHIHVFGKEESIPRGGTLLDLHKWHCHLFEKLGWMLLWKSDRLRVQAYQTEIMRLIDKLKYRYELTKNDDTKIDLHNMMLNTEILYDHFQEFLAQPLEKTAQSGGAKKSTKTGSKSKEKKKSRRKSKETTGL